MHCVIVAINIDGWCCCVMVGEREETDEVYAVENPGRRVAKNFPPDLRADPILSWHSMVPPS